MDKKTVLLVDDVKLFLRLEETFFQRAGCLVITAESGQNALRLARERKPDLILLDYLMPDLRGDQICKELRADPATGKIPIIIVSTSSKKEDIEACFSAGCDDYLTKPINPEAVLARSAMFLGINQRLHKRLVVNFRVEGEAPPLTFTGFSINLSQGGILFESEQKIQTGMRMRIWIPIKPDQGLVEISGEVVRAELDEKRRKFLYGIKFESLEPQTGEFLTEYLKKFSPGEGPTV